MPRTLKDLRKLTKSLSKPEKDLLRQKHLTAAKLRRTQWKEAEVKTVKIPYLLLDQLLNARLRDLPEVLNELTQYVESVDGPSVT